MLRACLHHRHHTMATRQLLWPSAGSSIARAFSTTAVLERGGAPRRARPGRNTANTSSNASTRRPPTARQKEDLLVKSVEDLEQILPNMPAEEQARLRRVIDEYGPGLNKYLQNAQDLSSFGSLDGAEDAMLPEDEALANATPYAQAVGLLTQFTERIYQKESTGEPVDPKEYKALWDVVRDFSKMKVDDTVGPPMQMLVLLFQFAKNLTGRPRTQAIRLVGDLLYRYQIMRLDPFNEVDYLLALSRTRDIRRALDIWESRCNKKDVENSIWWQEVGACLYLNAHNLKRAEALAAESQQKFGGYVSPKVVVQLIASHLGAGHPERAWEWYKHLIAQVRANGGPGEPEVITGDMDPEDATEVFNRKVYPSEHQLAHVLSLFLNNFQTAFTVRGLQDLKELNIVLPAEKALDFLKVIARNISRLEPATLKSLLPSELQKAGAPAMETYTPALLQVALEKLTEVSPELRDNPEFYVAWILALANMGNVDGALSVVNTMLIRKVSPSHVTFHTVIKVLLAKGKLEFALAVLEYMETGGASRPDVFAQKHTVPITPGPLSAGPADFPAKPVVAIPAPTSIHYALLLQYGARRKRHQFVAAVLERMTERGVSHDQTSILALLHYRYRAGDFHGVFAVMTMAVRTGIQFSRDGYTAVWTMLADFYRTHGSDPVLVAETVAALDLRRDVWLRMLRARGVRPDLELYGAAAGTMLRAGLVAEALAAIRYTTEVCGLEINALYGLKLMRIAKKVAPRYGGSDASAAMPEDTLMQAAQRERALERLLDVVARDDAGGGAQLQSVQLSAPTLIDAVLLALGADPADYTDRVDALVAEYAAAAPRTQ